MQDRERDPALSKIPCFNYYETSFLGKSKEECGRKRPPVRVPRPRRQPRGCVHEVTCFDLSAPQKLDDLLGQARAQSCPEHAHIACKPRTPWGLYVTWALAESPTLGIPQFYLKKRSWRASAG